MLVQRVCGPQMQGAIQSSRPYLECFRSWPLFCDVGHLWLCVSVGSGCARRTPGLTNEKHSV